MEKSYKPSRNSTKELVLNDPALNYHIHALKGSSQIYLSMDYLIDRASGSSSSYLRWRFDVFLSFRGEDTRSNFTSHLDMALRQRGINVFIDYKLSRGEDMSASLLKAIEESMILVVIISKDYASSSWCLDELVKIVECKKFKGQAVFPIFFKVDPSDVRKQTGSFGDALAKHQVKFSNKMQAWREALATISQFSGWVLQKENEADIIQKIVQEVLDKLNRPTLLHVAKYPVGIDYQMQVTNLLSHVMSDGITMVGIYGIGGMGKTTLAKALYNKIANQFEGCSFLMNIREASQQYNGLVHLQETLLSDILMGDLIKVGNLDGGINIVRNRLRSKKILLVLDDIDESQHLQVLAGGHDWFGPGSKIIVTTRNKHLLSTHKFDVQHQIQKLSDDKALELFSWHAFKKSHPSCGYLDISRRAVDYCKGLPLALVVLGSFLHDRDQSKWKSILDAYENSSTLDKSIQDILKISYDGLEVQIKEIFLDISCLFIGEHIDDVKTILEACGSCPEKGITNLMDLSLLTISEFSDRIEMHELIQQMGHPIALSESSNPRKRKRLFIKDDVEDVLNDNKETRAVKAIKLNFPKPTKLKIDARGFRNVKNLIFLKVQNTTFSGDLEYLSNSLKWIDWAKFPFSSFPPSYRPKNLIQLNLPCSFIKHLGKGSMNWESLKQVQLHGSKLLEEIPDFSAALNLQTLNLGECTNLVKVHESVGSLGKLVDLNLEGCCSLELLPSCLKLKSLKHLTLEGCKRLEQFPHIGEEMKLCLNLKLVSLKDTGIKEVPLSIENLTELRHLLISGCRNLITLPIYCLTCLETLDITDCSSFSTLIPCPFPSPSFSCFNLSELYLNNCNIIDASFLESLSHVAPSLIFLDLSGNKFSSLPSSIVNLTSLIELQVTNCKLLQEISKVPVCIRFMDASGCISLTRFPDNIADMISCDLDDTRHKVLTKRYLVLMNCDIPKWFSHQNTKDSITFCKSSGEFKALAPCVVFKHSDHHAADERDVNISIRCKIFINNIAVKSFSSCFSFIGSSLFKCMCLVVIRTPPSHTVDDFLKRMGHSNWPSDWSDYEIKNWNKLVPMHRLPWNCFMKSGNRNDFKVSFEVEDGKDFVTITSCGLHVVE